MALSEVEQVRLLIGDIPGSPFYPLYTDDQIEQFLDLNNQDIFKAARMAAISASFVLAGFSTRERTGDIEVYNTLSTQYMKALDYFINNSSNVLPEGLVPWMANSGCNKLLSIETCDGDICRDVCGCGPRPCACNCVAGGTF